MLKDEFEQKLIQVDRDEKEARKRESEKQPPRSDWGREAFSTRFSCHFCGEVGIHFNTHIFTKIQEFNIIPTLPSLSTCVCCRCSSVTATT